MGIIAISYHLRKIVNVGWFDMYLYLWMGEKFPAISAFEKAPTLCANSQVNLTPFFPRVKYVLLEPEYTQVIAYEHIAYGIKWDLPSQLIDSA